MTTRRPIPIVLASVVSALLAACTSTDAARDADPHAAPGALEDVVVEASCGQCQLGMPGNGCDLAVRVDGRAYLVDGTGIDDHGDAHGDDGFCNAVRRARVSGTLEGDRFHCTRLELLPEETE